MTDDIRHRSDCPIASTLDLVGDKWTLLIVRDMLFGASRFSDFVNAAEGIKRNILTDRLRRLERAGLVSRTVYQDRPKRYRYRLTERGAELLPAIQALARWGAANLGHTYDPPDVLLEWLPEDHFPKAE
jgi:DNA-binding HxlR family transcriptional regulator